MTRVHSLLQEKGCYSKVVWRQESVGVVHTDGMNSEPRESPYYPPVWPLETQLYHSLVDIVSEPKQENDHLH